MCVCVCIIYMYAHSSLSEYLSWVPDMPSTKPKPIPRHPSLLRRKFRSAWIMPAPCLAIASRYNPTPIPSPPLSGLSHRDAISWAAFE